VKDKNRSIDLWSLPLLFLWAVFLVAGLFPSAVYSLLRESGMVASQDAMVNSPHLLTLGFAGYMALFAYQRCRDTGMDASEAHHRAVFVFVVGLVAFLNFPFQVLLALPSHITTADRVIIQGAAILKLLAWGYLYLMVLRYYAVGNDHAFASLFPFAGRKPSTPKPDTSAPRERTSDEAPDHPVR
jgi:hypothetical protein